MGKFKNLRGEKFGRLTVIQKSHVDLSNSWNWICLCDCGKIVTVRGSSLTAGVVKSCGCYKKDIVHEMNRKHLKCYERIYKIYYGMRSRCYNKNNKFYKYYGERNIVICDLWLNSFDEFLSWSLDNGYKNNLSIDRINANENYCPENCRWANSKEQANNTRANVNLTYNGETHNLAQWSKILGINASTIYTRYFRGMSIESILYKGNLPTHKDKE